MIERTWSFYREDGALMPYTVHGTETWARETAGPGLSIIEGAHDPLSKRVNVETGAVEDWRPPQPEGDEFNDHEWDDGLKRWVPVPTLAGVRRNVIEELKRERDTRLEGGFVWDGSPFDSDAEISQPRLLGLFTSSALGLVPSEGQPWRLQDNTWRVLSAQDAQQVWGAFQAHMAGLFAAFAAHEAEVLSERDIDALRAYDTASGWP
jgi:hypothetical protein